MSRPSSALLAALVGLAAVALVARAGQWAYLKTRLPELAFIEDLREIPPALYSPGPSAEEATLLGRLSAAANRRASADVLYDPSYVALEFPAGDVPSDRGVCTDLVVRAYRDVGIDLQAEVNEDMGSDFEAYPSRRLWGAKTPDSNIDHRRVPNLMTFFERHGQSLPVTDEPTGYRPGEIVAWHLGGGLTHIGIVSSELGPEPDRRLVAHHVGGPPTLDDSLFRWEIIGHYRYFGPGPQDPSDDG